MMSGTGPRISEMALAAHPVATLVVDLDGGILYSNAEARRIFNLTKADGPTGASISDWHLRRMPLREMLSTASMSSNWIPVILFRGDIAVHARARGMRENGASTPCVLITSAADNTTPFVTHTRQIRELNTQLALYQKKSQELQSAVEVSRFLERELVHRVKNNLAIISALLNQQARSAGDGVVADALRTAASRIKSIAVVHDVLDARRQTDLVDLAETLSLLVDGIRSALCPKHIKLEVETAYAIMHINVVLPLALLVNELVTNAIKHAFVDRTEGRVRCICRIQDDEVEICVSDNGTGMPVTEIGSPRMPRIVSALAEQIGASIDFKVADGTEWSVRFPFDGRTRFNAAV